MIGTKPLQGGVWVPARAADVGSGPMVEVPKATGVQEMDYTQEQMRSCEGSLGNPSES